MYITGIGQAVLKLLNFKFGSGITKAESPPKYEVRLTENDVTSVKSQLPNIKN